MWLKIQIVEIRHIKILKIKVKQRSKQMKKLKQNILIFNRILNCKGETSGI